MAKRQGLVPSVGGSITLESLGMDSDFNNWASVLSSKEGSDSILYTKIQTSQNTVDLNTENGNWELKSIFKAGTYHYVRAQVHPKGDAFGPHDKVISIYYMQNASYNKKSPNGRNSATLVTSIADYSVQNEE